MLIFLAALLRIVVRYDLSPLFLYVHSQILPALHHSIPGSLLPNISPQTPILKIIAKKSIFKSSAWHSCQSQLFITIIHYYFLCGLRRRELIAFGE